SLSAGCLEDEVAARAGEVLHTGKAHLVSFDTRRRFGCSGKIEIYIEPVDESFFANVAKELDARREYVNVIRFNGHEFVHTIIPPLRVILFGDAADNPPILSLGTFLGWDMVEASDPNSFSAEPDKWTAAIVKTH